MIIFVAKHPIMMIELSRLKFILLQAFVLIVGSAYASNFKPIITNYSVKEYGNHAGIQNWDISQDDNGQIIIANNKGILLFDGYTWKNVVIPGNIIIRSVMSDGDRIYIGSFEEFGYFSKDKFGAYIYTSLSDKITDFPMGNEEVWKIIKFKGKIYFQTFNSAFIYDGKNVTAIHDSNIQPLYFHVVDNKIFAQAINGDYYQFDGKQYTLKVKRVNYDNDYIIEAQKLGDKLLLFTENKGIYSVKDGEWQKFHTDIDSQLHSERVNRAIVTPDSTIVVGTIFNGIYALNSEGHLLWHYNVENGLLNNSVLHLSCDRDGNIWAALDNGVALIHTSTSFSILVPDRNDMQVGMIYDIFIAPEQVMMATNQGFYSYSSATERTTFVAGTGGQNWHISKFDNDIFLGNNLCTMRIIDGKAVSAEASMGSTSMKRAVLHGEDVIVESTYGQLYVYRKDASGHWMPSNKVADFTAPIRQMEIDASGNVWAANMNKGLYRVSLSPDLQRAEKIDYYESLNDSTASIIYVMKVRGRIVMSDNKNLYTYDDIARRIVPYNLLNDALPEDVDIHSCTPVNNDMFWLSGSFGYILMKYEDAKYKIVQYVPSDFFGLLNNENNDNVTISGQYAFFNMNNGIVRCLSSELNRRWKHPKLLITSVETISENSQSFALPISVSDAEPAVSEGNMRFSLSFPNFNRERITFRFQISNPNNPEKVISTKVDEKPLVEYKNLPYGSYRFTAQAIDSNGTIISTATYRFVVARPFWLSFWAIIIYVIFAMALLYTYSKWRTDRALKKKRIEYEAERNKQNIKMLEQEKLIAQQQQQILQSELSTKSKELANLAMDVFAKEKVLENLKESIHTHKSGDSQGDMSRLLKKIEQTGGNMEFWDIYQKNFDLIHEHFFRNLRERYPSLTSSDLKFCALLRLNLSTKDIAKFTNLTIRGVETARYRIRKKLALKEGDSLIEFLIDFK